MLGASKSATPCPDQAGALMAVEMRPRAATTVEVNFMLIVEVENLFRLF